MTKNRYVTPDRTPNYTTRYQSWWGTPNQMACLADAATIEQVRQPLLREARALAKRTAKTDRWTAAHLSVDALLDARPLDTNRSTVLNGVRLGDIADLERLFNNAVVTEPNPFNWEWDTGYVTIVARIIVATASDGPAAA